MSKTPQTSWEIGRSLAPYSKKNNKAWLETANGTFFLRTQGMFTLADSYDRTRHTKVRLKVSDDAYEMVARKYYTSDHNREIDFFTKYDRMIEDILGFEYILVAYQTPIEEHNKLKDWGTTKRMQDGHKHAGRTVAMFSQQIYNSTIQALKDGDRAYRNIFINTNGNITAGYMPLYAYGVMRQECREELIASLLDKDYPALAPEQDNLARVAEGFPVVLRALASPDAVTDDMANALAKVMVPTDVALTLLVSDLTEVSLAFLVMNRMQSIFLDSEEPEDALLHGRLFFNAVRNHANYSPRVLEFMKKIAHAVTSNEKIKKTLFDPDALALAWVILGDNGHYPENDNTYPEEEPTVIEEDGIVEPPVQDGYFTHKVKIYLSSSGQ